MRANWRPLLAATFGLGTGYAALSVYTPSVIAPHLLEEFGWSKSEFAALGVLSLVVAFCIPFAGRLADVLGTRLAAAVGIVALPLSFVAYGQMTGPLWQYVVIYLFQNVFCITTTATIYTRVAVQYTQRARGLSLAIVASGPAVTGAILGPLLNGFIEAQGWRATYHLLTGFAVVCGILTLLLLPPERRATGAVAAPRRRAREDYPAIFRTPVFWVIIAAMLLVNLPQVLALSQMKLLLLDNNVTGDAISLILSAFAVGVLAGRFIAGLALDRLPAHVVGLLCLGLPGMGLLLIASGYDSVPVLTFAVLCIGFAFGGEGDIVAYIVSHRFPVAIYSSVMGLVTTAISISASVGAVLLSVTLDRTGRFDPFLIGCAAAVFVGSLMFLLLRDKPHDAVPVAA
ncbi:MAG: MFS transporter [Novosphingobium sp.]